MSITERGEFATKGLLTLVLVLFALNTISHDLFCHEELEGVCNPLHWSAAGAAPAALAAVPAAPIRFAGLSPAGDQDIIRGFISDIYHPPD